MPVAWSMPRGQRNDVQNTKILVGPGQYNPVKNQEHTSPTWKIGSEIRGKSANEHNPGPGNYDPKNNDNYPKYSLSKKFKQVNDTTVSNPGPGTYQNDYCSEAKARTPSYSLRKKNDISVKNFNPSPAAYQPGFSSSKVNASKYSFRGGSIGKRGLVDKRNVPGPGSYVIEKGAGFDNKTSVFGSEAQRVQQKSTATGTPGPGNYDSAVWFNNENLRFSKTMGTKTELMTLNEAKKTPPPGTYDPANIITKHKVPSYSMPKQIRGQMKIENNPPPNLYKIRKDGTDSPYWSFGAETRKGLGDKRINPGPGTYDTNIDAGHLAVKYSMPGKNETNDKEGVGKPGPGAYNPHDESVKGKAPVFMFGTGQRSNLAGKNANPGPGQYQEHTTLKRAGAKFYSEQRTDKYKNINPGPGNYENKTGIEDSLEKSRGYSMALKLEGNKKDQVVGPGAYKPSYDSSKKKSSTIRFGSEERGRNKSEMNPGPGAYESKGTNEASQWGFGSNARHTIPIMKGVPGPGAYESGQDSVKLAQPQYGFGLRPEIIDKDNLAKPGPGSYNPDQKLTKNKEATYKIGTAKRNFGSSNTKHVPGPGNYNPKSELNKRGAGIGYGKKNTLDVKSVGPGPGQYEIDRSVNPLPPFERNGTTIGQLVSVNM